MVHEITRKLERLHNKLSEGDRVDFYIASSHGEVPGGAVHGFGVLVIANGAREFRPIAGSSDTAKSSAPRGALAGTLTALEWAKINCEAGVQKFVNAINDYIYDHLPKQIDKWVTEPNRANRRLLAKILSEYDAVGRNSVQFKHLLAEDPYYARALTLAIKARDKEVERRTADGRVSRIQPMPEDDDGSDINLIDNIDWLLDRALSKDP